MGVDGGRGAEHGRERWVPAGSGEEGAVPAVARAASTRLARRRRRRSSRCRRSRRSRSSRRSSRSGRGGSVVESAHAMGGDERLNACVVRLLCLAKQVNFALDSRQQNASKRAQPRVSPGRKNHALSAVTTAKSNRRPARSAHWKFSRCAYRTSAPLRGEGQPRDRPENSAQREMKHTAALCISRKMEDRPSGGADCW